MPAQRYPTIDCLRGLAAFAVCWYHFTWCEKEWLGGGQLALSGRWGYLGVPVFFVISGFVIPLALSRTNYALKDYGRFLLRRIIRLDPPYLVAIVISAAVGYFWFFAAKQHAEHPPITSLPQLLAHFGYLNAFFGYEWINPVFWTLALEFQYYLLLGLLFPFIVGGPRKVLLLSLAAICSAVWIPEQNLVFHWLPLFALGIATFLYLATRISVLHYAFAVLISSAVAFLTFDDPLFPAIAIVTAGAIAFINVASRPLMWLGTISYSLYLVHYPIGKIVLGLGKHWTVGPLGGLIFVLLATLCSLLLACILHRFIEKPAQLFASAISPQARRPEAIRPYPAPDVAR